MTEKKTVADGDIMKQQKQHVSVMIVEDDPMARKLFEIILEGSGRYQLESSIESASLAEFYCMTGHVDLILMDVCTALHASGLDAAAKIKEKFPQIKIIIVTSQPECDFIGRARAACVDSFWYKDPSEDILLEIMDRTMAGESIYPDTTPMLRLGMADSADFTARELEVLRELTSGDTDDIIAERLHISVHTVKKHIKSMFQKTGFTSRTQLAVMARESGLVIRGF